MHVDGQPKLKDTDRVAFCQQPCMEPTRIGDCCGSFWCRWRRRQPLSRECELIGQGTQANHSDEPTGPPHPGSLPGCMMQPSCIGCCTRHFADCRALWMQNRQSIVGLKECKFRLAEYCKNLLLAKCPVTCDWMYSAGRRPILMLLHCDVPSLLMIEIGACCHPIDLPMTSWVLGCIDEGSWLHNSSSAQ